MSSHAKYESESQWIRKKWDKKQGVKSEEEEEMKAPRGASMRQAEKCERNDKEIENEIKKSNKNTKIFLKSHP